MCARTGEIGRVEVPKMESKGKAEPAGHLALAGRSAALARGDAPRSAPPTGLAPEWLAAALGASRDLRRCLDCIDHTCRTRQGRPRRIPPARTSRGARYFDIDEMADPDTDLPHMVPTPGRFARLLGAAWASATTARVVFYDQKGLASAARGWWLMGLFGHDDGRGAGRRSAEMAARGPRDRGRRAAARPAAAFVAGFPRRRLRGIGDVKRIVAQGGGTGPRRARAPGRFDGTVPEPRAGLPSGHMPGARNLPYTELLNADGMKDPADAARPVRRARAWTATRPVVTSCGSGVTACILTLGMVRAGLPEGAVYDGSWTEWAAAARYRRRRRRPDMPDDAPKTRRRRGFATRISHTGRAGKRCARLRQPAAASRLHRAVPDCESRRSMREATASSAC